MYHDPMGELRELAARVVDDVKRNGVNYDQARMIRFHQMLFQRAAWAWPRNRTCLFKMYSPATATAINTLLGRQVAPGSAVQLGALSVDDPGPTPQPVRVLQPMPPTTERRSGRAVIALGALGVCTLGALCLGLARAG